MSNPFCLLALLAVPLPVALVAQSTSVGPARGTVIVVGGGSMGPEIYAEFIKAAGGPDALIVNIPTAGGAANYTQDDASVRGWRNAGARNVVVLHTYNRKLADSDSFAAVVRRAGGVWFEGGRHFRLVDSYAGTRTERAFHEVLARGGVVGGSSAGATILGDFLVRGAPSNDNSIMDHPLYRKGFAFLRGVAIDQHVVARERLADLADSIIPKYPGLLGMSEDEGTAWVVRGDVATIIGRNKAFVYGAPEHDSRRPFLTLYPGDKFNLAARKVTHRAADESLVSAKFVDGLFERYADSTLGGATVLVARDGHVLVDRSYGIPDQPKYMPTTTVPQFDIGGVAAIFRALCTPSADSSVARAGRGAADTSMAGCVSRRLSAPVGLHKTFATADGHVRSSVDELYRVALGLEAGVYLVRPATGMSSDEMYRKALGLDAMPYRGSRLPSSGAAARSADSRLSWTAEAPTGYVRLGAYGTADGKRSALVQLPELRITVIILTNDETADARGLASAIIGRLIGPQR